MKPTSLMHAMAALACQATATDLFDVVFVWPDFTCSHCNTHDAHHTPLSHLRMTSVVCRRVTGNRTFHSILHNQ